MTEPCRHDTVIQAWNRYADECARTKDGLIDDRTSGALVIAMADDLRQALGLPAIAIRDPQRIEYE